MNVVCEYLISCNVNLFAIDCAGSYCNAGGPLVVTMVTINIMI